MPSRDYDHVEPAHIAIIGHTTSLELANGFSNRVLLIACRRQRLLPEGGDPDRLHGTGLDRLLAAAPRHAAAAGQVRLDPPARELWHHAYHKLATQSQSGIVAQITVRAEAQHHPARAPPRSPTANARSPPST